MICNDVLVALSEGAVCEETDNGARVATQCLYPSFEPVEVFVAKLGEGFVVSDMGGAANSAWLHGREDVEKIIAREALRYGAEARGGVVEARVPSADWLKSAILAVANASAASAIRALERAQLSAERELSDKIFDALVRVATRANVAREHLHRGSSGKQWRYDFVANIKNEMILLNAVTPHHASISAKYVAFADLPANDDQIAKMAVFERPLDTSDASLMTQVATLVPIGSLESGVRRRFGR